jgi:hypothetical protein
MAIAPTREAEVSIASAHDTLSPLSASIVLDPSARVGCMALVTFFDGRSDETAKKVVSTLQQEEFNLDGTILIAARRTGFNRLRSRTLDAELCTAALTKALLGHGLEPDSIISVQEVNSRHESLVHTMMCGSLKGFIYAGDIRIIGLTTETDVAVETGLAFDGCNFGYLPEGSVVMQVDGIWDLKGNGTLI